MKRMLDKEQLIKYNLLTYLEKNKNVTYEELELTLHLSRKTLKKYITLLIDDLANYGSNTTVLTPLIHNVTFEYGFEFSSQVLMNQFILSSLRYKVLMYALNDSHNNKFSFIQIENISESTYYRLLKEVNESILNDFNIKLDSNLIFQGDEHQIRYFFFCLHRETKIFEVPSEVFRFKKEFNPLIDVLEKNFAIELTTLNKEQFQLIYQICKIRNLQGYKMRITFEMQKVTRNNDILLFLIDKVRPLFEDMSGDDWKEDITFFFVICNSFPLFDDLPKMMEIAYDEHVKSNNILYRYVKNFKRAIHQYLPQLEMDPLLKGKIIQFYCRTLVFDGFFINDTGPLYLKYFKKHRPYYLAVLQQVFLELLDYFKTDNNTLFTVFHSMIIDCSIDYSEVMPPASIAIQSQSDPVIIEFYRQQISHQLKDDYRVELNLYRENEHYDIVLSDQFNVHTNADFTYRIRMFPDPEQTRKIKGIIKEIIRQKVKLPTYGNN